MEAGDWLWSLLKGKAQRIRRGCCPWWPLKTETRQTDCPESRHSPLWSPQLCTRCPGSGRTAAFRWCRGRCGRKTPACWTAAAWSYGNQLSPSGSPGRSPPPCARPWSHTWLKTRTEERDPNDFMAWLDELPSEWILKLGWWNRAYVSKTKTKQKKKQFKPWNVSNTRLADLWVNGNELWLHSSKAMWSRRIQNGHKNGVGDRILCQ